MTAADLDRVEASVDAGLTLPGSWYLDRELYELEREAIAGAEDSAELRRW